MVIGIVSVILSVLTNWVMLFFGALSVLKIKEALKFIFPYVAACLSGALSAVAFSFMLNSFV